MIKYIRFLLVLAISLFFHLHAQATHNRAGEIIVEQINGCNSLTIRATIITYTKASSVAADRDTLTLCWGDGLCDRVLRDNGPGNPPQGDELENDVKRNRYVAIHTYPSRGRYKISMTDPNRNGGILNVNFPGSENVQFHLQTTYTFLNSQFQGCNSTPQLLQPPIDIACAGQPFTHNPNAFDAEGDSLSYQLVVPMQDVDTPVPNYVWPQNVEGNIGSSLQLNEFTGELIWDSPQKVGEYNIAMIIISWRNGIPIDTVLRDMQIFVKDCDDNQPPHVETIDEICVVAGEVIEFDVTATDPDLEDKIKLTAFGGPFAVETSPADNEGDWLPWPSTGSSGAVYENQPVSRTFRWQTACEHISNQYYTIVFRAVDNYFDTTGLADLKTVRIKVVGPPPEDVRAEPTSQQIEVSWVNPYVCEEVKDDYFFGFSVWRREGGNQFDIDTCTPGLAGRGYIEIEPNTEEINNGRYYFTDTEVERGRTYCYRILAEFARLTENNPPQPFNLVESLPSDEICVQLSRDVPLITNVSIDKTATSNGIISIRWVKPLAEDLDTLLNAGPYTYELWRAQGFTDRAEDFELVPGGVFTSPTFWQLTQDFFVDEDPILNTQDLPYTYRLAFYVNGEEEPLGYASDASSVFLSIASTDETNNLSWEYDVPWDNFEYIVYRKRRVNPMPPPIIWDSIALVKEPFYSDQGLYNGVEYCYFVQSKGSYGVEGIPSPLLNLSQEDCGIPLDTIPPCPPRLVVEDVCDQIVDCTDEENLVNNLHWTNPMRLCPETDDVVGYNIYFTPRKNAEFVLIGSIDSPDDTTFTHRPEDGIVGFYAVTAIDTFFNESAFSNIDSVLNCPKYLLPNTFTPNDDGQNDQYRPRHICFVDKVEMQIFNVWGQLIFETDDPYLEWDGTNRNGEELPAGTYYYACKVFEEGLTGLNLFETQKGFIDLIRGR